MKSDKHPNSLTGECANEHCAKCSLCQAVNFEANQLEKSDPNSEVKSLYNAETLNYYFYFMPATKA